MRNIYIIYIIYFAILGKTAIELEHVTKQFGKFTALNDVSWKAETGTILAMLGPNGSGKTTTFRCILGLLKSSGKITVNGMDSIKDGADIRKDVGYLPQHASCYEDLSTRDNLKYYADLKGVGRERIDELLTEVKLKPFRKRKAGALSGGMRQRLMLAIAMLADPPILILDEPTANVDVQGQLEFRKMLGSLLRKDRCIIISTHLLREAHEISQFHGSVIIMNKGNVIGQGLVDDFLKKYGLTDHIFIDIGNNKGDKMLDVVGKAGFKDAFLSKEQLVVPCDHKDKYEVLKSLETGGITIGMFRVEEPSLEKAFMEATGREGGMNVA
jgi:ABC-type multidrug transport system ATPase subunit|tara:strand:- start:3575 stop:4555 length:981 start_codon:yes stop_codon:yes gene_type:complete